MSSTTGMTARDYQHKRFRSRASDGSKSNKQQEVSTIDSTPLTPKVITPQSQTSSKKKMSSSLRDISIKPLDLSFQPPAPLDAGEDDTDPLKKVMNDAYLSRGDINITMDEPPPSSPVEEEDTDPLKKIMSDTYVSERHLDLDISIDPPPPESPFLHEPTASNQGITTESPLKVNEPMRYSLSQGKQPYKEGVTHRRASDQGGVTPSSRSSSHRHESRRASEPHYRSSGSSRSRIRKQDPNSYKIFILLLQPESKIFELIQLIYNPNDTSVGNILTMIPENATENALGSQPYVGLCRPKTQEEILNKDMLASEARPGLVSAKITLGEILVAIPKGYTGQDVSALSKQILANPKIVKLLKRADPLAPKKKRSSRSGRHRRSSHRSSSRENVHVLEKLGEEAEDEAQAAMTEEDERKMKEAMQKAKAQASEANAAITDDGGRLSRSNSFTSASNSAEDDSTMSASTGGSSYDESYSSWSKSFDASFSAQSSICSGVSKRAVRRRDRQARRLRILKQSAVGAFVVMIAFYLIDTHGKKNTEAHALNDMVRRNPMGLTGVFQCLFLLLALYKVERLVRSATNEEPKNNNTIASFSGSNENNEETEHRCPFLRASNAAMKRFKAKYAKKLKRAKKSTADEKEESSVVSKRLKNFSLRPSLATGHATDNGDDTR